MGTNTLNVAYFTGQVIQASHVNEITAAFLNDFTGRNSLGEVAIGKNLGNETYPWGDAFIQVLKANMLEFLSYSSHTNAALSGDDTNVPYADKVITYLTNNGLNSILDFSGKNEGRVRIIVNKTGKTVLIKPTNVITPENENFELSDGTMLQLIYDNASTKWRFTGGAGGSSGGKKISGSVATPLVLTSTIPFSGAQDILIYFCKGTSGGINLSGINPQIANGVKIGQELWLICTSGVDTFQLGNGNNIITAGDYLSDNFSIIKFLWTGSAWLDIKR